MMLVSAAGEDDGDGWDDREGRGAFVDDDGDAVDEDADDVEPTVMSVSGLDNREIHRKE